MGSSLFEALRLALVVRGQRLRDYVVEVYRYYSNRSFRQVDLALLYNYLFDNPYTRSRHFSMQRGEPELYDYGETPLTTLEAISDVAQVTSEDDLFELGCGRGRACFWLHAFRGCRVTGIDLDPHFIGKAVALRRKFGFYDVTFLCKNFLEVDLSDATVIYLYGTTLKSETIDRIGNRLRVLAKGVRVVSVSYQLPGLKVETVKTFPFLWGDAEVYFQEV